MNEDLKSVLELLPPIVYRTVSKIEHICEIRLRRDRHISVFDGSRNIICEYITDRQFIENAVIALCKGSLYPHMNTICEGYIALDGGFRIGVCGSAVTESDKIKSVSDISSICIRVPNKFEGISKPIFSFLKAGNYNDSVLLYSPPGVGKTTVLRDICKKLAAYPAKKRVAIIDTRKELADSELYKTDNIDIYQGYPKAAGIMIATRCMAPEYIICDEIGSYDEAVSLLSVQNCGVPVIASAHAKSLDELLRRSNIKLLHDNRLFSAYIGITRSKQKYGENIYTFNNR